MTSFQRFRMNRPKVVHEAFDDNEVVIINLDSGSYYSLDKVGGDILGLIEDGATVGEVVEVVADLYQTDGVNIENAVNGFLEELQQQNLIVPCTASQLESVKVPKAKVETGPAAIRLDFKPPILRKYTDMQELLLLDPIHEVDETGWPKSKTESSNEHE